jgi:acetyltransferase-like isoleucine patch superfamily enzyme
MFRKRNTVNEYCWIGANVAFLGRAYLARGSIVGAGAVVNKQYPPFSIIAGVPAVVLRSRLIHDGAKVNFNKTLTSGEDRHSGRLHDIRPIDFLAQGI